MKNFLDSNICCNKKEGVSWKSKLVRAEINSPHQLSRLHTWDEDRREKKKITRRRVKGRMWMRSRSNVSSGQRERCCSVGTYLRDSFFFFMPGRRVWPGRKRAYKHCLVVRYDGVFMLIHSRTREFFSPPLLSSLNSNTPFLTAEKPTDSKMKCGKLSRWLSEQGALTSSCYL